MTAGDVLEPFRFCIDSIDGLARGSLEKQFDQDLRECTRIKQCTYVTGIETEGQSSVELSRESASARSRMTGDQIIWRGRAGVRCCNRSRTHSDCSSFTHRRPCARRLVISHLSARNGK